MEVVKKVQRNTGEHLTILCILEIIKYQQIIFKYN